MWSRAYGIMPEAIPQLKKNESMTAPPGWTWKQSHHSSNYNDGKRTIVWLLFDFDPPVHMCVVLSWSKYYSAIIPYFGWPYLGHLLRYSAQKESSCSEGVLDLGKMERNFSH